MKIMDGFIFLRFVTSLSIDFFEPVKPFWVDRFFITFAFFGTVSY